VRSNPTRLLLIDRDQMFMDLLSIGLQQTGEFEIVATACNSEEGYFRTLEHRPDVVLCDVEVAGRGAFTIAEEIQGRLPVCRFIFLTGFLTDVYLDQALRLNAAGYILKQESFTRLVDHLRQSVQGKQCYSPEVTDRIEYDAIERRFQVKNMSFLSGLTSRQLEVLRHLARGESVKEVAKAMVLSERAIESHKYRIMQKLGIHDRVELTRYAIREGLTLP
jgi:DNA-binding NarL/FixJ family response regulator